MLRVFLFVMLFGLLACSQEAPATEGDAPATEPEVPIMEAEVCLDSTAFDQGGVNITQQDSSRWLIQVRRRGIPDKNIQYMDWYFHRTCDPNLTVLDSLIVHLREGWQLIQPFAYTTTDDREVLRPKINFVDFNFDGFLDFRIFSAPSSTESNRVYSYYLYDSQRGDYRFSDILSQTTNLHADPETGKIKTFRTTGHQGKSFRASTYIFRKDELIELSRQQQDFLPDLGVSVLEYYQLRNGTFLLIDQDTIKAGGAILEKY
jgi:hypothetical protein